MVREAAACIALACAAVACSSDGPSDEVNCPKPLPAFRVRVTAFGGPLPADTKLSVHYGAADEEYNVGEQDVAHDSVFCKELSTRAGDAGVEGGVDGDGGSGDSPLSLDCELWTQGSAEIKVTGGDFPPLNQQLEAELNGPASCGTVKTVDYEVELTPGDAGAPP